jgi:N-acetylglucosamine-6-phosphate deacetylase
VAAGHCDPTLNQLQTAIDTGLSMFTHLGNGCPMQLHRHNNIIQRALSLSDRLWISFIGDGIHIPYPVLGNYLRCAHLDRVVITTDAMKLAGLPPGRYELQSRTVELDQDLAVWAPGKAHLIGGAMPISIMADRLANNLRLKPSDLGLLLNENARHLLTDSRITLASSAESSSQPPYEELKQHESQINRALISR